MSVLTNEEFAAKVVEIAGNATPFEPHAYYDPDGDCIEFLAKNDSFYGERVDDLVTVYRSHESKEIIGSLIKGVSRFCKEMLKKYPGLRIEIEDGNVRLVHIFRAKLWNSEPSGDQRLASLIYKKLIEVAEESDVEVDAEMSELCSA